MIKDDDPKKDENCLYLGIILIGPQIESIQDPLLSDLSELTIMASSIAGFDILTKNVFKIANEKINL